MAQIPDLSKLNGNKSPEPDAEPTAVQARTAFLVVVGADGNVQVTADLGQRVEVEKQVTTDDIYNAATLICKDIQVQQTAALVTNGLMQMGSLIQQQTADQAIRQRLNLK